MKSYPSDHVNTTTALDQALARNKDASSRLERKLEQLLSTIETEALDILLVGGESLSQVSTNLQTEMSAHVRYASSGCVALQTFADDPAELVVVDAHLSDMPVQEFLSRIRALSDGDPMATIVVATDLRGLEEPRPLGNIDSAIKKPMLLADFVRVVKQQYNLKNTGAFRALVQAG